MGDSRRDGFRNDLASIFLADSSAEPSMEHLELRQLQILVLCTGNICRSPLIEVFLRQELATLSHHWPDVGVRISSKGLHAVVGAPVDPVVHDIAMRLGVSTADHRAQQFEPAHATNADLILTATTGHRDEVVSRVPAVAKRSFTLIEFAVIIGMTGVAARTPGERTMMQWMGGLVERANTARQLLAAGMDLDIPDPYRRSLRTNERVAQLIGQTCATIGQRLG